MIMYTSCIILYIMSYNVQIDEVYQNKHAPKSFDFVTVRNIKPFGMNFGMYCSNIYPYLSNLEIHGQIYSLVKMQLPIRFPQHQEIWTTGQFNDSTIQV